MNNENITSETIDPLKYLHNVECYTPTNALSI